MLSAGIRSARLVEQEPAGHGGIVPRPAVEDPASRTWRGRPAVPGAGPADGAGTVFFPGNRRTGTVRSGARAPHRPEGRRASLLPACLPGRQSGQHSHPALNSSADPLPERTGSAAGNTTPVDSQVRRPRATDPGQHRTSQGRHTGPGTTDVVPPGGSRGYHRATVTAEQSADVWRS